MSLHKEAPVSAVTLIFTTDDGREAEQELREVNDAGVLLTTTTGEEFTLTEVVIEPEDDLPAVISPRFVTLIFQDGSEQPLPNSVETGGVPVDQEGRQLTIERVRY